MRPELIAPLLLVLISPAVARAAEDPEPRFSPKISLRTSGGMLMNSGTKGGSTSTYGGLNAQYLHFLTSRVALGGGFNADFDFSKSSIPVSGPFLSSRFYFYGNGTRTASEFESIRLERHDNLALYAGADLAFSNYYLGSNRSKTTDEITGSFLNANLTAGLDLRLSTRLQLNVEGNAGLLSFSGSDDRYRIMGYLAFVGLTWILQSPGY